LHLVSIITNNAYSLRSEIASVVFANVYFLRLAKKGISHTFSQKQSMDLLACCGFGLIIQLKLTWHGLVLHIHSLWSPVHTQQSLTSFLSHRPHVTLIIGVPTYGKNRFIRKLHTRF